MATTVETYFDSIKGNHAALRQFFSMMPKGGDIHNHLTGSAYAETYFEMAVKKGLYVDLKTGKLYKEQPSDVETVQLTTSMSNFHDVRMWLIDKWSIRNFEPYKYPLGPDEYFFGTFGLLSALTSDTEDLATLMHELKVRAVRENVQYLEVIGTAPSIPADCYLGDKYEHYAQIFQDKEKLRNMSYLLYLMRCIYNVMEANEQAQADVENYLSSVYELEDTCNGMETTYIGEDAINIDDLVCRYQGYAVRSLEPLMVFAQLYIVHKACVKDERKLLVGCNIVAAENGEKSMAYYMAHMIMFAMCKNAFPDVGRSLHAGELTMGLIRPEYLTDHIYLALYNNAIGAKRIGHGVDLPFEKNIQDTLNNMKNSNVCVEINLTSNEFILGVAGDEHPIMIYHKAGIPIAICTDDPGILRTSLTEQYALATKRYGFSYSEIKTFVYNSINYSFLSDTDKSSMLSTLDSAFASFEAKFS